MGFIMRYAILITLSLAIFVLVTGCRNDLSKQASVASHDDAHQLQQLQAENQEQRRQLEALNQRLENLSGFEADRFNQLIQVNAIELGRYSGGYDDDKNGVDDGIKVYLVPRDRDGDVIKAAGKVYIELWDLELEKDQMLLGHWDFAPGDMRKQWLSGLRTNHYKLMLPWPENKVPQHANLTLKLIFIDILTGKIFEVQKMYTVSIESV